MPPWVGVEVQIPTPCPVRKEKGSASLGCQLPPHGSKCADFLLHLSWYWSSRLSPTPPFGGDNRTDSHWCTLNRKVPTWPACCCLVWVRWAGDQVSGLLLFMLPSGTGEWLPGSLGAAGLESQWRPGGQAGKCPRGLPDALGWVTGIYTSYSVPTDIMEEVIHGVWVG